MIADRSSNADDLVAGMLEIAAAVNELDLAAEFQERGESYVDLDGSGIIWRWSPPEYCGEVVGHI